MKKRIAALTLAAIMLCSCSADTAEESVATPTATEAVTAIPKTTTAKAKTTTKATTTKAKTTARTTTTTTPAPVVKNENYYEGYDLLYGCTFPTKSNNGIFIFNDNRSDKVRQYFFSPSLKDYYYEYTNKNFDNSTKVLLTIDNYIYHHIINNNVFELLRTDTNTWVTSSINVSGVTDYTLGDNNKLYIITHSENKYVDESSGGANIKKSNVYSLEEMDLQTLSSKKLFDFEKDTSCSILAVYKNKAYIQKLEKNYRTIYELDLKTKTEKKIFDEEAHFFISQAGWNTNLMGIYKNKPYIFYIKNEDENFNLYMCDTNGKSEMLYSSKNQIKNLYIIDSEIYIELYANSYSENIVYKINNTSAEFVGFSDYETFYIFKDPYTGELLQVSDSYSSNNNELFIGPLSS